MQTRDGYLWFGTEEGLARFDGVRFTVFDMRNTRALDEDIVQGMAEGADGRLWAAFLNGLVVRDPSGFRRVPVPGALGRAVFRTVLAAKDGSIWFGTDRGAGRLSGGTLTVFLLPAEVRSLAEDREGVVWIGTTRGLAAFRSGRVDREAGGPLLAAQDVRAIAEDSDGALWIATGTGLFRRRGGDFARVALGAGASESPARTLYRDREGALWMGMRGALGRWWKGRFESLPLANGNNVVSLAEDREGSLWIGTDGAGLLRLKDPRISTYTVENGLSDDLVWGVREDSRGVLWATTRAGGINRLASGASRFEAVARLGVLVPTLAEGTAGELWLGTMGRGLARLAPDGKLAFWAEAQGLAEDSIWAVCPDPRDGSVWIGTVSRGLIHFRDGRFTTYTSRDGLPCDRIRSLLLDPKGDLWIGTWGGGLARFSRGRFETFGKSQGQPLTVVLAIANRSGGGLWLAGREGLAEVRDERFFAFGSGDARVHATLFQIVEDGRGSLWLGGNHGIFRVRVSELERFRDGRAPGFQVFPFGTADGMRTSEGNSGGPGAVRTRDGRVWFATNRGLAVADSARLRLNAVPPPVAIERLLLDRSPLPISADREIPPGRHDLQLDYTALCFRNPSAVRFRYRLEGFDRDWIQAGSRRSAYYTNLPPGPFRFVVTAANEDGVWNLTGASTTFSVARFFYDSDVFRGAVVALLLAVAFGAHRLRLARIGTRERLRTALVQARVQALQAQLRPHFLFNALNSMLPLIGQDPGRARAMVVGLGDLLRLSLTTRGRHLVRVEQELSILERYVEIEKMRFRERLEFSVEADPAVASAEVPSFLLQPLVENAIVHGMRGPSGRVRVRVRARRLGGETLELVVEDDGPGIAPQPPPSSSTGVGLKNTRHRLETLYPGNFYFELMELPQGGSAATIRIPLSHQIPERALPDAGDSGSAQMC